jgi:hypothetical protein
MDLKAQLAMEAPPTEVIFGIAKKFTIELEKYPLHTHSGIISMMNMMASHRKAEMDLTAAREQQNAQDAAMNAARAAHAAQQVREDEKARRIIVDTNTGAKPELVTSV